LQLDESAPELPQNVWSLNTLVYARPAIRSAAGQLLANWRDEQQCGLLAEEVARLLRTLPREEISLELIALLEKWGREESVERLERIWLRPVVKDNDFEKSILNNVRFAAGKALAAQRGEPINDFLRRRLNDASRAQVIAALNALSDQMLAELIGDVVAKLDDRDPEVRYEAANSLSQCKELIADKLLRVFQSDQDENVRFQAAATLGVQCDQRVLPHFLSLLRDGDPDQRAEALSILWRFPEPEVLDAVYNQAMRDDYPEVLHNATLVLTDALDPRAGEMCLRLLQSGDQRSNLIGASFVCSLEWKSLSEDVVKKITDLLAGWLNMGQSALHLAARSALMNLHDRRGYQGLSQALKNIDDPELDSWRSMALMELASLAPDDFQPLQLRALLQDRSPWVRANAALVAGQYRSRDLIEELRLLLDDESVDLVAQKTVATLASEALDRIAGKRERWQPAPRKPTFKAQA
jgi:HEAT repeat protein